MQIRTQDCKTEQMLGAIVYFHVRIASRTKNSHPNWIRKRIENERSNKTLSEVFLALLATKTEGSPSND